MQSDDTIILLQPYLISWFSMGLSKFREDTELLIVLLQPIFFLNMEHQ